jgi:peptide chain release factor 2
MGELKVLRNRLDTWEGIKRSMDALDEIYAMAIEESEASFEPEIRDSLADIRARFDKAVTLELMTGEADRTGVFLSIHAGSGGTEACDWAGMLFRMYTRWAERRGFKYEVIDMLEAEGGIKSVTLQIDGAYAYGHMRCESGVHRLVRISPFDANKRRHTSFVSLDVIAELEDDIDIEIKEEDLEVDTFRSGGSGGQHVNKTDSAIRIRHKPSGIVVACQAERSQHKNRSKAMNVLKAKLYEMEQDKLRKSMEKFYGEKGSIAWGSQIRSYVLQPYTMVKDLRTGVQTSDVQGVLDGDLQEFIDGWLKWKAGKLAANVSADDLPE